MNLGLDIVPFWIKPGDTHLAQTSYSFTAILRHLRPIEVRGFYLNGVVDWAFDLKVPIVTMTAGQ
jgi:hypothetical protein